MKTVFITGVSAGIGHALAELYLARGFQVCGVSRRVATDLADHPNMIFARCDLTRFDAITGVVDSLFARAGAASLEALFINAGSFGPTPKLATETSITEFHEVLNINVSAAKSVLDACLSRSARPQCVAFSASISAIRPRPGMLSYSVSKAALNALVKSYALENPDIFFAVLGLCIVDTELTRGAMRADDRFDDLVALRARATSIDGYLATPDERARDLAAVLDRRVELGLQSGQFKEIRELTAMLDRRSSAEKV
ncbi:SDR family oxidoreductase [Methylosinus sp. Ce-a6]|uniref:SDR family NAD(P)-dependent oxidoreductase n=1 Tax=Methylosinus sp. Ce-a6 TaxID=2172005 RepID=UPI00135722E4|nr:SDR family oxidoreductase [Methylosinus sp. Ce-a6]